MARISNPYMHVPWSDEPVRVTEANLRRLYTEAYNFASLLVALGPKGSWGAPHSDILDIYTHEMDPVQRRNFLFSDTDERRQYYSAKAIVNTGVENGVINAISHFYVTYRYRVPE